MLFYNIKIKNLAWLFLFSIPFLPYFNLFGADFSVLRVFLLFFIMLLMVWVFRQKIKGFNFNAISFFILLFLLWSFGSLFWSINFGAGAVKWALLFNFFAFFILMSFWFNKKSKKEKEALILIGLKTFVWSSLVVAIIGFLQFIAQFFIAGPKIFEFWVFKITPIFSGASLGALVVDYPSWFFNFSGQPLMRAVSVFPDPHMLAFFMGMASLISLAVFLKLRQKIFLFNFLFLALVLFLTFSRGGYLGFLLGIFIFIILYWRASSSSFKKWFFIFLIIVLAGSFLYENVAFVRLLSSFDLSEGSNLGRLSLWRQSFDFVGQRPFFGHGLGSYSFLISPSLISSSPITAHNLYLEFLVETGSFGLLLFLAPCLLAIRNLFFGQRKDVLLLGPLCALIYFLTHSFFEIGIFNPPVFLIFSLILLLASSQNLK